MILSVLKSVARVAGVAEVARPLKSVMLKVSWLHFFLNKKNNFLIVMTAGISILERLLIGLLC